MCVYVYGYLSVYLYVCPFLELHYNIQPNLFLTSCISVFATVLMIMIKLPQTRNIDSVDLF